MPISPTLSVNIEVRYIENLNAIHAGIKMANIDLENLNNRHRFGVINLEAINIILKGITLLLGSYYANNGALNR